MSCSSNWLIARRRLIGAAATLPLVAGPLVPWAAAAPALAGLRRMGSGEFRRLGLSVYRATLWASEATRLQPPYALAIEYHRRIPGRQLAASSIDEMRALGHVGEDRLASWGRRLEAVFPDVRPGDVIVGTHRPQGATFHHNDRWLADIDEADFARAFFAIWLDPRTRAPELRDALLQAATR